jgi:retron-type reverse transcriptase
LHHAIYRILYPFFEKTFIADSYSCQLGKGAHKAINRFRKFAYIVSKNNTKTCWILKCDIRKFFANIDHEILLEILAKYILDKNIFWLLENVIESFENKPEIGLPLGNLTSQLFVNIYLNEFDQFVKHGLKAKYYIRYCDDFVILSKNKIWLEKIISRIKNFLEEKLKQELHQEKVFIKTLASGIDFLGFVAFPHHRILRTKTKKRMLKRILLRKQELERGKISQESFNQSLQSYLGILKHCEGYKIGKEIAILISSNKNFSNTVSPLNQKSLYNTYHRPRRCVIIL